MNYNEALSLGGQNIATSSITPIKRAMEITEAEEYEFEALGVNNKTCKVLAELGIEFPTPIQEKIVPLALGGRDVIGIAQTGTGKTLAFALPIAEKLAASKGFALVLVPTRELAIQVGETFRSISPLPQHSGSQRSRNAPIYAATLIGGMSMHNQVRDLHRRPRVVIATPGRLIDHINRGTFKPNFVSILVLDEADRMFDMGFAPQIRRIIERLPKARQTMLFSATMPPEIEGLASGCLTNPERIAITPPGTGVKSIEHEVCFIKNEDRYEMLLKILSAQSGSAIIFARTKHGAMSLNKRLQSAGLNAVEIHSNRTLGQRKQALAGFKSGRYQFLIATDIAARGIDVEDVKMVINFDLPDAPEDYVHRVGRTGRAGRSGKAFSLATLAQFDVVNKIEKLSGVRFNLSPDSIECPMFGLSREVAAEVAPGRFGRSSTSGRSWGRGRRGSWKKR